MALGLSFKLKAGIGIIFAYTAYSAYVQIRTSYEISERARKKLYENDLTHAQSADWPTNRFGSMMIAGRYVNPFTQYRPQTVFEFVFCRINELFHVRPRGGVPSDPQLIAKLLPSCQPDFDLLFRTNKRPPRQYNNTSVISNSDMSAGALENAIESPALISDDSDISSSPTPSSSVSSLTTLLESEEDASLLPPQDVRATLTWLGQSCAYVQLPGLNILTDPCLGEHLVSPYVGPKRISPAPCKLHELPPVDLVLVSHDHPDHFELDVAAQLGNSALWIVPTGVGRHLAKLGITNFRELDWWQRASLTTSTDDGSSSSTGSASGSFWKFFERKKENRQPVLPIAADSDAVTPASSTTALIDPSEEVVEINPSSSGSSNTTSWEIACTPAMHWSGRKMIDSNETLWCSFMILRNQKPVFFHAGDTGYSPELFQGIRKVFGSGCQLAMLPCGAYEPRWHLRPQHTDPYEALQIMQDLGAHKMVGVHWGTFVLSDEYFLEPRDKLHMLAKREQKENDVIAPEFGKTLVFRIDHDKAPKGRKSDIRLGYSLLLD